MKYNTSYLPDGYSVMFSVPVSGNLVVILGFGNVKIIRIILSFNIARKKNLLPTGVINRNNITK